MSDDSDPRLWSTTARGLTDFVGAVRRRFPSTSVRTLHQFLKENQIYPPRDAAWSCGPEPPDVFFSYHSAQNFVDVQEIVWKALDHAAQLLRRQNPDVSDQQVEALVSGGIRLWVDFMFIDQSARDLRSELDALPQILRLVRSHFVLGEVPLSRAWCCYEIALFNQAFAAADGPPADVFAGPGLRSFVAPSTTIYHGWDHTETSEAADKEFLAERIATTFPNGFPGFDHVMQQANAVAVLAVTERSTWYTPAAEDALGEAAQSWYARMIGRRV